MPTFEVIVPAYNASRFLAAALDSVISQTLEDWRILLVDDGSTDATPEIAAAYAERLGPRMIYVRRATQLSATRKASFWRCWTRTISGFLAAWRRR